MPTTRAYTSTSPMLFSPLPLPFNERPVVKYRLKGPLSLYVPPRSPSPTPDATLVEPPPIPAELSHCHLVMYGYRVDDTFALEAGFPNRYLAAIEISRCIDQLGISGFTSMPSIPRGQELYVFCFAEHHIDGPVWSIGGYGGIPAEKIREVEVRMNIKRPAEWINFDEIHQWWKN